MTFGGLKVELHDHLQRVFVTRDADGIRLDGCVARHQRQFTGAVVHLSGGLRRRMSPAIGAVLLMVLRVLFMGETRSC